MRKLKLIYMTRARLPGNNAASLNITQNLHAFKALFDVKLYRARKFWNRPSCASSVQSDSLNEVPIKNIVDIPFLGSLYALQAARSAVKEHGRKICYARSVLQAYYSMKLGLPCLVETHSMYDIAKYRLLAKRLSPSQKFLGFIVLNEILKKDVISLLGSDVLSDDKVLVEHDAVAGRFFNSKTDLRATKRVGYFGRVCRSKGVHHLLEIAQYSPDVTFEIFGNNFLSEQDLLRLPANVSINGFLDHNHVHEEMGRMDLLIMPPPQSMVISKGDDIALYTSPMKLFEYMATSVPVICYRAPATEQIVSFKEVYFVEGSDPVTWAKKINSIFAERGTPSFNEKLRGAYRLAQYHSLTNRSKRIFEFIEGRYDRRQNSI